MSVYQVGFEYPTMNESIFSSYEHTIQFTPQISNYSSLDFMPISPLTHLQFRSVAHHYETSPLWAWPSGSFFNCPTKSDIAEPTTLCLKTCLQNPSPLPIPYGHSNLENKVPIDEVQLKPSILQHAKNGRRVAQKGKYHNINPLVTKIVPGQFRCGYPECAGKKVYKRSEHLKRHWDTIHNPSKNCDQCPFCPRKFNRSDNYTSHLRLHKDGVKTGRRRTEWHPDAQRLYDQEMEGKRRRKGAKKRSAQESSPCALSFRGRLSGCDFVFPKSWMNLPSLMRTKLCHTHVLRVIGEKWTERGLLVSAKQPTVPSMSSDADKLAAIKNDAIKEISYMLSSAYYQNDQLPDQAIYIHPTLDTLYLDFHLNHLPRVFGISDSLRLIRHIAIFAKSDLGPAYRLFISKRNRICQLVQFDVQAKDICSAYFDPFERICYRNGSSVAQCLAYFRQPKERNPEAASSIENVVIFPRLRTLYLIIKDDRMGETIAPSAVHLPTRF